jgi:ABC-type lipopolysaccharide export system ATPase subunit
MLISPNPNYKTKKFLINVNILRNPFAGLTPTLIAAIQQSIVQQINQNKPSQSSDHSIESLMSIQQNQ